ncbi:MAG TPA: S8 family serine peptidase [Candidatus Thermoplasmatota archaeon]|nr:S8 family serine peptidase [Candidatus Thermoplasmatota archaeon]
MRLPALLLAGAILATALPSVGSSTTPALPRIAVLDSGIDAAHPEFAPGQVVAWKDFVQGRPDPYDDHWHGTATASLAAGLNHAPCGSVPKLSFAPGAPLVIGKVLNAANSLATSSALAQGIDWAVAQQARVVSISIGSATTQFSTEDPLVRDAVARATAAGVLVVVSSGNGMTLRPAGAATVASGVPWPAWTRNFGNLPEPLVVGPVARNGAGLDTGGYHLDPDVVSWGVSVCAAQPGGIMHGTLTGSSFATPLVAGMAAHAIALAEDAGAPSDPAHVKRLLTMSARNAVGLPYAREGLGFLLDGQWPTVAAHAAAGTFPDYAAQGAHAQADLLYAGRVAAPLRDLP